MNSFRLTIANFILLFLLAGAAAKGANIIPQPAYVQEKQGTFNFAHKGNILYSGKQQEVNNIIKTFIEQVSQDYELNLRTDKSNKADILLQEKKSLGKEAYELSVTSGRITINASTPAGFFYGLRTLNQLILSNSSHTSIPCILVKDTPRFSYRGFLIDAGRYYLPLADVKKAIDLAANYKLNRFHWHLTDDQGWRLEIKKYPRLTEQGSTRPNSAIGTWDQYYPRHYDGKEHSGYYTQEEIRDIVNYAVERQITIVPEIEMPGHALAALSAYPEYACSFHSGLAMMAGAGISDQVYCPKPQTFQFIKDILTEVADLFPGEYIHIGGDECPKTSWEKCNDCQALIKKENLKDEFELHAYFIQQVEKIADGLGRKLIGWDEVLEGALPLKATVMSWRGEAGGIKAAQLGNDVIMTPNTYCYLDYYQENPEFAPLTIGGFVSLERAYDYEPIPTALTVDEAKCITGIQGNIWGEYVATIEKFEYMAFPRLLALAEVAWSQPENKDRERFIANLKKEFSFFQKRNVNTCREYFRPRIQSGWNNENGKFAITLETICPDADIRYTLDGAEPTSESKVYKEPIYLSSNTCVKAIVTDKDKQVLETPTVKNFRINKATGCSYTLSTDTWSLDWYDVKPALFTDGVQGFIPSNSEWAAIVSGVEIVIDLKKNTTVSGVGFGTMIAPINSVLPAKSMECYLSADGKEYQPIGQSTFSYPIYKGMKEIYHNYVNTNGKEGRYLKLVINGQTELPADYPYPNGSASIALDEIEVY
ncbi:family 20 glycosylhydrolase [Bacteroides sp.]|uniref:beta-N-acetylhexosaminidase n=1 Tax=Bacteroides sp. TaxID=29523 RepID=UPI002614D17E|nr:family 20 glycosylhydrolase [Bacteroides sp.]